MTGYTDSEYHGACATCPNCGYSWNSRTPYGAPRKCPQCGKPFR